MSGTNPLFRLDRVLGDDILGDEETARLNDLLTDLSEALDEAGVRLEEVIGDVRDAAEEAGLEIEEVLERAREAAEDLLDGDDAANGGGDGGGGDGGAGDGGGGGAAQPLFAILLPQNNSGALGFAAVTLDGNALGVQAVVDNVSPDGPHPLHIHGFADDRTERPATIAEDTDGDGHVETAEGAAAIGPVLASLTASGEVDPALGGSTDFVTASAAGRIVVNQTYQLAPGEADDAAILAALQERLAGRFVQMHGAEIADGAGEGTTGEVNGTGGYVPILPIAAGQLLPLPAEVTQAFAANPAALLEGITAFLGAVAPYTLKADGSGPIAPDPLLEPDTGGDANGGAGQDDGTERFVSLLLPSNNSGVFGAASITFDENAGTVVVDLDLGGLEADVEHGIHIHGFTDDRASLLPNLTLDADRDGFVEEFESASVVGPVRLSLTEDGSISDAALAANFPEADANGYLSLEQTYAFDLEDPAQAAIFAELQDRMEGRQLQVHGLTVDEDQGEGTRGEVEGVAGYQPLLAVANGAILSTEDPGGEFAATLGALVQASLEAQAAEASADATTATAAQLDQTLIA